MGHPSNIPHLVVRIIQPDLCLCKFWEVFAPNETINTFGKLPTPWLRVNENKQTYPETISLYARAWYTSEALRRICHGDRPMTVSDSPFFAESGIPMSS